MAKPGYRRPFRKWFAETAESPLILFYGAAFGAVSGFSGANMYSEAAWDASSVTLEQEETFTAVIDQKFSDIEALQSQKSNILFSKQTAEFNDDFKLLKEFSQKENAVNRDIIAKSSHLAEKLMLTPAISEKTAQTYSDKFSEAGLNNGSAYNLSELNMKYRNECLNEESLNSCIADASEKGMDIIGKFTLGGAGACLLLSFFSLIGRSENAFNSWAYMEDVPTLKTKINGALEQKKPSKLSN